MKRLLTAAIGLLLILFYCSGCSSAWKANMHLRKAQRHIRKAEALGAHWSSDTLYRRLQFTVPGIDVKFIPQPIITGRPMVFKKDSVTTTVEIRHIPGARDTVIVHTVYPPRVITKVVPMEVNKEIKADSPTLWQRFKGWALIAVVFFTLGWIVRGRAGPVRQWLSIRFDKNEKPSA